MSEADENAVTEAVVEPAAEAAEAPKALVGEVVEMFPTAVPEAFRSTAEQVVDGSREVYERTKDALEGAVEMLEASIDRAGQGAAALNRKAIEIAQVHVNSGFDLAKELAGAKNVTDVIETQSAFARKQLEMLTVQAEEIRSLSSKVATDTAEPLKSHMTRSIEVLRPN